jgi:DNA-binding MarR family transcriptional regulator
MQQPTQLTQRIRQAMAVFTHLGMRDWSSYARANGISMPQFSILMLLHHRGSSRVSEISEHMDISVAAASQLVDKLVQHGWIERTEVPHDRRAKQITLAAKGQDLIRIGCAERYRWIDTLAERLNAEERQQVSDAMGVLTRILQSIEEQESLLK